MWRWILVLAVMLGACSVMDADDARELDAKIGALPPVVVLPLIRQAMAKSARDWLTGKSRSDIAAKIQCRSRNADLSWGDWEDAKRPFPGDIADPTNPDENSLILTVDFFIDSLQHGDQTYLDIFLENHWKTVDEAERRELETGRETECRQVWAPGYAPSDLPDEATNPDKVLMSELRRFLIETPVPPPGFPIEVWGPELCPLAGPGSGWCPPKPDDTGGATSGDRR